jgi:CRISPR/Cas system CSM-associated protein Csm4 (group 5 of RAMP superfamily)
MNYQLYPKGESIMADRRPRATREEALNAKIAKNEEAKAKLLEKLESLNAIEADLKKQLKELSDIRKKAERAAEAKAKREEEKKAKKDLIKAIQDSGLSIEEIRSKLGIE